MINWKLETRKIKDLKEHPRNPRQLKGVQAIHLQKSLETFGMIDKPIINQDNQIIGGHQRLKIFKKMLKNEIECWVPDRHLEEKEVDELCIRLNKNTGEWDWECMGNEWNPTDLLEWGFHPDEIMEGITDTSAPLTEPEDCGSCELCGQKLKKKKDG